MSPRGLEYSTTDVVFSLATTVKSSHKSTELNRTIEKTPAALSLAYSSVHLNSLKYLNWPVAVAAFPLPKKSMMNQCYERWATPTFSIRESHVAFFHPAN